MAVDFLFLCFFLSWLKPSSFLRNFPSTSSGGLDARSTAVSILSSSRSCNKLLLYTAFFTTAWRNLSIWSISKFARWRHSWSVLSFSIAPLIAGSKNSAALSSHSACISLVGIASIHICDCNSILQISGFLRSSSPLCISESQICVGTPWHFCTINPNGVPAGIMTPSLPLCMRTVGFCNISCGIVLPSTP